MPVSSFVRKYYIVGRTRFDTIEEAKEHLISKAGGTVNGDVTNPLEVRTVTVNENRTDHFFVFHKEPIINGEVVSYNPCGSEVTLSADVAGIPSDLYTIQWEQIDGDAIEISDPTADTITYSNTSGDHKTDKAFQVIVTNNVTGVINRVNIYAFATPTEFFANGKTKSNNDINILNDSHVAIEARAPFDNEQYNNPYIYISKIDLDTDHIIDNIRIYENNKLSATFPEGNLPFYKEITSVATYVLVEIDYRSHGRKYTYSKGILLNIPKTITINENSGINTPNNLDYVYDIIRKGYELRKVYDDSHNLFIDSTSDYTSDIKRVVKIELHTSLQSTGDDQHLLRLSSDNLNYSYDIERMNSDGIIIGG